MGAPGRRTAAPASAGRVQPDADSAAGNQPDMMPTWLGVCLGVCLEVCPDRVCRLRALKAGPTRLLMAACILRANAQHADIAVIFRA